MFFRKHAGCAAGQQRRVVSVRAVESHPFVDKPDAGPWSLTHLTAAWASGLEDSSDIRPAQDVADRGSMPPPFEKRCDLETVLVLGGRGGQLGWALMTDDFISKALDLERHFEA